MTDARVPNLEAERWIKPLSCLDPGAKLTLAALWSFAPFGAEHDANVTVTRRMLSEETGQTFDAVKRQIFRLSAAGWIYRVGDGWDLRWRMPEQNPVRSPEPGHVYVIEFSDGTVKVGKSVTPSARIASHASTAACFGIITAQVWTSGLLDCGATERATLEYLRQTFESRNGGEFFVGGFDAAVAFVGTLEAAP